MADGEGITGNTGDGVQNPQLPTGTWFEKADADTQAYISQRGLADKDPVTAFAEAAKAHKAAEAYIGVPKEQLLRLPKADAPPQEWDPVYQRLGAPADPKEYDLTAVKFTDGTDVDPAFQDFIRSQAAALHLPKDAAPKLAESFVKFLEANDAADATERTAALETARTALKTEWGHNYDSNLVIAKQAALALGVTPEAVAALEGQLGYDKVMALFHTVGTKIGEDKFIRPAGGQGNAAYTKSEAQAKIAELKADTVYSARYLAGGQAERREMDALHQIAFGEG